MGSRPGSIGDPTQPGSDPPRELVLVGILLLPIYLNDFFLIPAATAPSVLAVDYVSKLIPLAMLALMPSLWWAARDSMVRRPDWQMVWKLVLIFAAMAPVCYLVSDAIDERLPETVLFKFPPIDDPLLHLFDLTIGLTLNSFTEELIGRGILGNVLSRRGKGSLFIVLVSSLIFSLAHWSTGAGNVFASFVFGAIFMGMFLKTGSIWPGVILHTAYNIVVFA